MDAGKRSSKTRPVVYGHRGTRRGAPENTLTAMRLALAQGADGVEIDVRTCAGGEPIVLHDPDLIRIAGVPHLAATTPWPELRRIDLGAGERVALLEEALELVLGGGHLLNIELKSDVPDPRALVAAVAGRVGLRPAHEGERLLLSSFSARICRQLRAAMPRVPVAWIVDRRVARLPPAIAAIHPHHALLDANSLALWRAAGLAINVWTVNHKQRAAELATLGVDGIITDDVPLILGAIGKKGPL